MVVEVVCAASLLERISGLAGGLHERVGKTGGADCHHALQEPARQPQHPSVSIAVPAGHRAGFPPEEAPIGATSPTWSDLSLATRPSYESVRTILSNCDR